MFDGIKTTNWIRHAGLPVPRQRSCSRGGLMLFLASLLAGGVGAAQQADPEVLQLRQQVEELRQRIETLERRLDAGVPARDLSEAEPEPGGWRIDGNWLLLEKGMDHHRLREVLGEPENTRRIGKFRVWEYPNGEVRMYFRRVTSWSR